ncbi:putative hydrolase or acyltransferase of alpha/beta superfamily [Corynebacterium kutscheri]|uniref:Alpha/beta hydrolase family protein n=1 Tax=Corynebacterium kutscheri TaxID=35755 RepID=A0A0F6R0H5_9CORY|nr:alpha/beta hydrolase [Corynebacterium kutscheri]AKE40418.1 putative hydrolase or acyltransferase of alpha/beta superfamily [Corynebacterium kutscheri]VEH05243.1 alpha/beta hydrolase family protein [Corynebacterium kutscheri]VEH10813.1 alpha/beta hydrolase family protein [Corynebacterium kutscheri]
MKHTHNLSPTVVALDGPFTHQMLHTRGVRLHAATSAATQTDLIILLHDGYGGWFDYRHCIHRLAQHGFHVAAIDLRGYGMSDKPPTGYEIRYATGDIAGAIRTLGHERAHVFGAGVSATIAWVLATSHPGHVRSIGIVDGLHPVEMRRALAYRPWERISLPGADPIERDLRAATTTAFQATERFDEELLLRHKASQITSASGARAKTLKLSLARPPVKWLNLTVEVPVHMLVDDSPRSTRMLALARKRARSQLVVENVDSMRPHLESPEAFAASVAGFMA